MRQAALVLAALLISSPGTSATSNHDLGTTLRTYETMAEAEHPSGCSEAFGPLPTAASVWPDTSGLHVGAAQVWGYFAAGRDAPVQVWDLETGILLSKFTPRNGNGRGIAYDPTDGTIWTSTIFGVTFSGDGLIHKNLPFGPGDLRAIPEPGGPGGNGLGALDYDPEENVLWAASYKRTGTSALFYKIDPSNGAVLLTCSHPFQGIEGGNDTLAVARPSDLGGTKVILTDAGEARDTLFALNTTTCAVETSYLLPIRVTGIDIDDNTGNLIATNLGAVVYNLGPAPYDTIIGSVSSFGFTEDISLGPPAKQVPVDIKPTSCRNPFLVQFRGGILPVAVLGFQDLDVNHIDPDSIRLEGVAPLRHAYEDVATPFHPFLGKTDPFDCTTEGADGFLDLTLKFSRLELLLTIAPRAGEEVQALMLSGHYLPQFGGGSFFGQDVVVFLRRGP